MKKSLLALFVFAALFTAQAQPAYACSCVRPGTPQEEMENADAVFSGTVTRIEDSTNYGYDVTLEVSEAWKGVEGTSIVVHTGMGGGDCGFGFEEGQEYVVYASLTDGELHVYSCGLTGILAESNTADLGDGTELTETKTLPEWTYGVGALVVIAAAIAYALISQKK